MSRPLAVITGGEGDLARAIAQKLGEKDYEVLTPGRDKLDVRSQESVTSFFASLEEIAVLINNAGITGDALFARQSPDTWDDVLRTNLKGAHLCSQAAAVLMMRKRNGSIVNIGSYSALHPPAGQTSYAASKAGLIGLTKSYAKELGKRNIRTNLVLPGFLETRMTAGLSEEAKTRALARHALNRFNTVEEAADFICYLAETKPISGQVFQLDSRV